MDSRKILPSNIDINKDFTFWNNYIVIDKALSKFYFWLPAEVILFVYACDARSSANVLATFGFDANTFQNLESR